jgi:transcriptional regulator with XRE-family HTH domain
MAKKSQNLEDGVKNITLQRIIWLIKDREGGILSRFLAKIGTTTATYYSWVNRDSQPKLDFLVKIRDAYGVTLDWLAGDGQDGKPNSGTVANRKNIYMKFEDGMAGLTIMCLELNIFKNTIYSESHCVVNNSALKAIVKMANGFGGVDNVLLNAKINPDTFNDWALKDTPPPDYELKSICGIMGISPGDLVDYGNELPVLHVALYGDVMPKTLQTIAGIMTDRSEQRLNEQSSDTDNIPSAMSEEDMERAFLDYGQRGGNAIGENLNDGNAITSDGDCDTSDAVDFTKINILHAETNRNQSETGRNLSEAIKNLSTKNGGPKSPGGDSGSGGGSNTNLVGAENN